MGYNVGEGWEDTTSQTLIGNEKRAASSLCCGKPRPSILARNGGNRSAGELLRARSRAGRTPYRQPGGSEMSRLFFEGAACGDVERSLLRIVGPVEPVRKYLHGRLRTDAA